MSNVVVSRGGSATISVTFTGDGATSEAQVDLLLPNPRLGYSFTATSRNAGGCYILPMLGAQPVLRVFNGSGDTAPLPTVYCEVTIAIHPFARYARSGWLFSTQFTGCYAPPNFVEEACEVDLGYVTLR